MGSATFIRITQSMLAIAATALHATLPTQTRALAPLKRHPSLAEPYRHLAKSQPLSSARSDGDSFRITANTLAPSSNAAHDARCHPMLTGSLTAAPVVGVINAA
jgi:hypothetical protein